MLTHVEPVCSLLDHAGALSGEVSKVGRENRGGDDAARDDRESDAVSMRPETKSI